MKFWKMNGAGNDFIIVDGTNDNRPEIQWSRIAAHLCERHLSIGADGFMVVKRSDKGADYRMLFFNSDGSMGEMCGNGARCIARYGCETKLAGDVQTIETTAGIVTGWRITERLYRVRLNDPEVIQFDVALDIDGKTYLCDYVELGNPGIPHAVVPISGLAEYSDEELKQLGRKMRYSPVFSKGANVNFYEVTGKDSIYERTYERGVEDLTYACGTGTGSVVVALTLRGLVSGKDVAVDMRGGTLRIDVERGGRSITDLYLTGPTNIVAVGEIRDEDLDM